MKSNLLKIFILIITMLYSQLCKSQEPVFSQHNRNLIFMNPAYSGLKNIGTFSSSMRQQWPSITSKFSTQTISLDSPIIGKLSSSFSYIRNFEGEGFLISNYIRTGVSYPIPIIDRGNGFMTLKIGLEYQNYRRSVDWSKLIFLDELHPVKGNIYSSSFIPPLESVKAVEDNFNLGFLLVSQTSHRKKNKKIRSNYNTYYVLGASAHNIVKRSDAFLSANYFIPRKMTVHGELWWNKTNHIEKRSIWNKLSILKHSFLYQQQSIFKTLQLGILETDFYPFNFGFFLRSQISTIDNNQRRRESVYFKIGFNKITSRLNTNLSFSKDFTISSLRNNTSGTNEIVLTISTLKYGFFTNEINQKKKKIKNDIKTSCNFYKTSGFSGNLQKGEINPVLKNKTNKRGIF
tara:strand:- start:457 stop:1665 length:1209 start_codon:yes stop_codon:yes gene_type:complete